MWKWLTAAGVLAVATGLLPAGEAAAVLARVAPVLVFLAAITVVAELADAAGVFGVAADAAARLGRGSVPALFGLTAALATATTVVLSLDTTVVLLTPIVITLAVRLDLPPAPFAVLTLWLANTASLLLPVSNLTNLLAAGVNVAAVATAAALVLLVAFAARARHNLTIRLLPWRLVLTTLGLFLLVQTGLHHGADDVLTATAGTGTGVPDLLRLTSTAAAASNLVNNLPAYLALEPDAQTSAARLAALLIGTNAGPLLLPWGSLATLLWLDRCHARNLHIPARQLAALALLGVPPVLTAGVLTLAATHP